MQKELDAEGLRAPVYILGVNEAGHESGNASICSGRDLPWLQESAGESVWDAWEVTYRDVIILDDANEVSSVYNLTEHNLANTDNYNALKDLLRGGVAVP